MNFKSSTILPSALRTTLHKTHYGFTVLFPTMEVKSDFKHSSKYLLFLSIARTEMKVS